MKPAQRRQTSSNASRCQPSATRSHEALRCVETLDVGSSERSTGLPRRAIEAGQDARTEATFREAGPSDHRVQVRRHRDGCRQDRFEADFRRIRRGWKVFLEVHVARIGIGPTIGLAHVDGDVADLQRRTLGEGDGTSTVALRRVSTGDRCRGPDHQHRHQRDGKPQRKSKHQGELCTLDPWSGKPGAQIGGMAEVRLAAKRCHPRRPPVRSGDPSAAPQGE